MVASSQGTRVGMALFEYDFTVHAGAQGTIVVGTDRIPIGAIIMDGIIHVVTAVTSGAAGTVAIHIASSEDILAVTAKGTLSLDALLDIVPDGTAANAIRLTAAGSCSFVIGTADLTAGQIVVGVRYIDTE